MEIKFYDLKGKLVGTVLVGQDILDRKKSVSYQGKFYRFDDGGYYEIEFQPAIYATIF